MHNEAHIESLLLELPDLRRKLPLLAKSAGLTTKQAKAALDELVARGEAHHEYSAHHHYYRRDRAARLRSTIVPPGGWTVVPPGSVLVWRAPDETTEDDIRGVEKVLGSLPLAYVIVRGSVRVHTSQS